MGRGERPVLPEIQNIAPLNNSPDVITSVFNNASTAPHPSTVAWTPRGIERVCALTDTDRSVPFLIVRRASW